MALIFLRVLIVFTV